MMFSDTVHPHLSLLGETLTREEIDYGMKQNDKLHEIIATDYNKANITSYGENSFPNVAQGHSLPPSYFQPIESIKSKEVLKQSINDYDKCFQRWKQSGFHNKDIPTDTLSMTDE